LSVETSCHYVRAGLFPKGDSVKKFNSNMTNS
jgi:hypothetical protein